MEGFWYWIATGHQHHYLKGLWGYRAKEEGRKYPKVEVWGFNVLIENALYYKVTQNPYLQQLLVESTLPLYHYYLYGGVKVVVPASGYFQMDYLEELRFQLRHQLRD